MSMSRSPRKGEHVCTCPAYRFPHRFGGGHCSGMWIVVQQWESYYGGGDCRNCNSYNTTEHVPYCEVYEGGESVQECPVWQEFVSFNEIRMKK